MTVVELEIGPAVVSGLIGGAVMLVLLYAGIVMMPDKMRMNLLLMLGGMMGLTGAGAYIVGLMIHAGMSAGFGVIHAAIFAARDYDESIVAWGLLFGLVHAIVTGMGLGMMPAMHPLIRAGRMEAPGVMATKLGRSTAMGFVMLHLIFGALVAVIYDSQL